MLAVLFLPFPKGTSYGNTNVAFILLIFIVWLFRVSTRRAEPPGRTPLDVPIIGLVMAYCISFYNVQPEYFALAWGLFMSFLTYLLIYFMVIAIVKSTDGRAEAVPRPDDLVRAHVPVRALRAAPPGHDADPGMDLLRRHPGGHGSGVRVGSTFLDYELFGEYCALNLFLQMFLFTRATTQSRRYLIVGIMGLTFFCLFSTVTRGAIISFMVGSAYLMWLSRHRLNFVRLVMVFALAIPLIFGADYIVANFTNSDSVLERLFGTELKGGVPETRSEVWSQSLESVLRSPWIGHGPYMASRVGVHVQYWPHNVYIFYAYITGVFGLAFFLWFLWGLWQVEPAARAEPGQRHLDRGRDAAQPRHAVHVHDRPDQDRLPAQRAVLVLRLVPVRPDLRDQPGRPARGRGARPRRWKSRRAAIAARPRPTGTHRRAPGDPARVGPTRRAAIRDRRPAADGRRRGRLGRVRPGPSRLPLRPAHRVAPPDDRVLRRRGALVDGARRRRSHRRRAAAVPRQGHAVLGARRAARRRRRGRRRADRARPRRRRARGPALARAARPGARVAGPRHQPRARHAGAGPRADADAQWKAFDAKLRNQVRKAEKSGLRCVRGHGPGRGLPSRVLREHARPGHAGDGGALLRARARALRRRRRPAGRLARRHPDRRHVRRRARDDVRRPVGLVAAPLLRAVPEQPALLGGRPRRHRRRGAALRLRAQPAGLGHVPLQGAVRRGAAAAGLPVRAGHGHGRCPRWRTRSRRSTWPSASGSACRWR